MLGLTATGKETRETLISPEDLLDNYNNALIGVIKLDFKILNLNDGLVQTRITDTLCHNLGRVRYFK